MKRNFIFALLAAVAITLTSCGKVPQAEIDSARAAVENLKTIQADVYVAVDFLALQDSLNAAMENVEKVNSKFLFKNFDEAKTQLETVIATSATLAEKTETVKAEVKLEAETALVAAQSLLDENKKLVEKAPKGKEGKAAIDAIKAEIAAMETALTETSSLLESGNFMTAKDKVKAASAKLTSLNEELKAVIAKVRR